MQIDDIKEKIEKLKKDFNESIKKIDDVRSFEEVRIRFLGRKGFISELFKILPQLDNETRKESGKLINELKQEVSLSISKIQKKVSEKRKEKVKTDPTLPGYPWPVGRYHPITTVLREIKRCFRQMGFSVVRGPEVETQYYNFEALNIPKDHPAREMHDTLYLNDDMLMRTHTSPVQVRVMEKNPPPIRIISPGRCYRRDTPDATHSPVFWQVEGLCVDEGVTFSDLKGVIQSFAWMMFGKDIKIRFRPSYFPFTEPSAEYDFSCMICGGKGCRICKGTGWIEISGAGMVNPAVFKYVNYDSERYTGYAFGMGVERIAMLLYGINDIRLFYENDVRFLNQF